MSTIDLHVTGIQHIGVPTGDIYATIAFYKMLGFEITYETVLDNTKVAFLQLHNLVIETYESDEAAMKPGAFEHIALDCTDIEKAFADVKKIGLVPMADIESLPFFEFGVRFFKITGPNKEVVEFCQRLTE